MFSKCNFLLMLALLLCAVRTSAQEKIVNPDISYMSKVRMCTIASIAVSGVEDYEDYMLTGISGLSVGQEISLPGSEITEAVKRYWKHGLFSEVRIAADSIVADSIYLHIYLKTRPRVSSINYYGLKKKSERSDLEQKLGLLKGSQITPNMMARAKLLAQRYFESKGFKNAEVTITQRDDVTQKNYVILDIDVDKKQKTKVKKITIDGNEEITDKMLKGGMFSKGALQNLHEVNKFKNIFKKKKFTPERYEEDKQSLITKYNELGYRDAIILEDSVSYHDEKHVNIYLKVREGKKYYIRNITWAGNTVYKTDVLARMLGIKKGDVYNQTLLNKRLKEDEDAVGNAYWDNGYIFYDLEPVEINIVGDSIDLEMRIREGMQAHISHVRITGNTRLYEKVVRRELRVKPGDIFSK